MINKYKNSNNKIFEQVNLIGKRVKIDQNLHPYVKNVAFTKHGDGYGYIIEYNPKYSPMPYLIEWNNKITGWYGEDEFNVVEYIEPEEDIFQNVKWWKDGELTQNENKLHENKEHIGKKVKIRDDSDFKFQAYRWDGDGYGYISNYDPDRYDDFFFTIKWNNHTENKYRAKDFDFIKDIEPEEDIFQNVKWWKDGKLTQNENKLYENKEYIGRKVKIRNSSPYAVQAYSNSGDGYGYISYYDPYATNGFFYTIKWSNGHVNQYRRDDFDIIEDIEPEEDIFKNVKWWKDGKLTQNENKLYENKKYIGRKVKIRDNSPYRKQAYVNGGDGYGYISNYNTNIYKYDYEIKWNSGKKEIYREMDFDFIEDIEPEEDIFQNVKWWKNGKLE